MAIPERARGAPSVECEHVTPPGAKKRLSGKDARRGGEEAVGPLVRSRYPQGMHHGPPAWWRWCHCHSSSPDLEGIGHSDMRACYSTPREMGRDGRGVTQTECGAFSKPRGMLRGHILRLGQGLAWE
eukprot:8488007-Pyramimonas_sp.AAC.1